MQGRSQEQRGGGHAPNRRLSGFFTKENWLFGDVGPALVGLPMAKPHGVNRIVQKRQENKLKLR